MSELQKEYEEAREIYEKARFAYENGCAPPSDENSDMAEEMLIVCVKDVFRRLSERKKLEKLLELRDLLNAYII